MRLIRKIKTMATLNYNEKIIEHATLRVDQLGNLKAGQHTVTGFIQLSPNKIGMIVDYQTIHPQKLGLALIAIREEYGIEIHDLARKLEITMEELEAMCNGRAKVPDYIPIYLIRQYNINAAYLYDDRIEDVFINL